MIIQAACNSFKQELLGGVHDLDTDVIKIALYTANANLGSTTTTYTTISEVVGTGYTGGGKVLTGAVITLDGSTALVDFDDAQWVGASFTAAGALIYNSSKLNRAIAVLNFGGNKTVSQESFVVTMPAPTAAFAIIRVG